MPIDISYENVIRTGVFLYALSEIASAARLYRKANILEKDLRKKMKSDESQIIDYYKKGIENIETTSWLMPITYIFNKKLGVPMLKTAIS